MKEDMFDPQVIKEGNWRIKNSNKPSVSLKSKVLAIPMGDSSHDKSCRAHEFGHIGFSLPKHQRFGGLPEFGAIEDCRVNMNLNKEGISVYDISNEESTQEVISNLKSMDDYYTALDLKEADTSMHFISACIALSCEGLNKNEEIREACGKYLTSSEKIFIKSLRKYIYTNRTDPDVALKASVMFNKYFLPSEQEKREQKKGDEDEDGKKKKAPSNVKYMSERLKDFKKRNSALKNHIQETQNKLYNKDRDGNYYPTSVGNNMKWGTMAIIKPQLNRKQETAIAKINKKRAMEEGTVFRYPHRFISDKAVFAVKARRKGTGTILIDMSGSMPLDTRAIMQILDYMPNATVLGYGTHDRSGKGEIFVLAKHGRTVSEIPHHGYQNGIDGLALEYMIQNHRGPYYFLTDERYTAYHKNSSSLVSYREQLIPRTEQIQQDMNKLLRRKNVKMCYNKTELMKTIQGKKDKHPSSSV